MFRGGVRVKKISLTIYNESLEDVLTNTFKETYVCVLVIFTVVYAVLFSSIFMCLEGQQMGKVADYTILSLKKV